MRLLWSMYRNSKTRYSGHLESRLMRIWAQHDQTSHFSYYMRGERKEELRWRVEKCVSTQLSLFATAHTSAEVERMNVLLCCIIRRYSTFMSSISQWKGRLASSGPSYRCTCQPGYTNLGWTLRPSISRGSLCLCARQSQVPLLLVSCLQCWRLWTACW
jgi:hypothetical protein